jgi:hypothetical protein
MEPPYFPTRRVRDLEYREPEIGNYEEPALRFSPPSPVRERVRFTDALRPGKRSEVPSRVSSPPLTSSRRVLDEVGSPPTRTSPIARSPPRGSVIGRRPLGILSVSQLQSDAQVVERLQDLLRKEELHDEEEDKPQRPQKSAQVPRFQGRLDDDIAARLAEFKKKTEALMERARRTVASVLDPAESREF